MNSFFVQIWISNTFVRVEAIKEAYYFKDFYSAVRLIIIYGNWLRWKNSYLKTIFKYFKLLFHFFVLLIHFASFKIGTYFVNAWMMYARESIFWKNATHKITPNWLFMNAKTIYRCITVNFDTFTDCGCRCKHKYLD